MLPIPQVSAGIIAGGQSRRFGRPKALAQLQGQPLIEYAIRTAGAISNIVMLSYGTHHFFPDSRVVPIADRIPDCGPLGGIFSVLVAASTPWVAVLPCDMPLLRPEVYEVLYAHREEGRPVVACSRNGLEPLVSLWPVEVAGKLESRLKEGRLALHRAVEALEGIQVSMVDHFPRDHVYLFRNVNYPQDLEAIAAYLRERGGDVSLSK